MGPVVFLSVSFQHWLSSVILTVCVHLGQPPRLPLIGRYGRQCAPVTEAQRGHGAARGRVGRRFRCHHQVELGQLGVAAADVPPGESLRCVLQVQKQASVLGFWLIYSPMRKLYLRSLRAFAWRVCLSAVCRSDPVARSGPGKREGRSSLDSPRCWRAGGKSLLFSRPVCKRGEGDKFHLKSERITL